MFLAQMYASFLTNMKVYEEKTRMQTVMSGLDHIVLSTF